MEELEYSRGDFEQFLFLQETYAKGLTYDEIKTALVKAARKKKRKSGDPDRKSTFQKMVQKLKPSWGFFLPVMTKPNHSGKTGKKSPAFRGAARLEDNLYSISVWRNVTTDTEGVKKTFYNFQMSHLDDIDIDSSDVD